MKTTKLILFILTLYCNFDNSFGQTYYSFPDSNAFWSSEGQNCFNPLTNAILTNGDGFTFSCFKQNDTVLYFNNPFCNSCFCSLYVDIIDNKKQVNLISISPNPITDCSNLFFTSFTNNTYSLVLYNSVGEIQRIYSEIKNGNINICKGELKAGIYLYELKVNDRILCRNKVAIK